MKTFNRVALTLLALIVVMPGLVTVVTSALCFARIVTPEAGGELIAQVWNLYGIH